MADKKPKNPLFYEKKTVWEKGSAERIEKAFEYAQGYVKYLDASKTEREAEIKRLTFEMKQAAKILEFEHAAMLRDKINKLRGK